MSYPIGRLVEAELTNTTGARMDDTHDFVPLTYDLCALMHRHLLRGNIAPLCAVCEIARTGGMAAATPCAAEAASRESSAPVKPDGRRPCPRCWPLIADWPLARLPKHHK